MIFCSAGTRLFKYCNIRTHTQIKGAVSRLYPLLYLLSNIRPRISLFMQTRGIHEENLLVPFGVRARNELDIFRAEFKTMANFAGRLSSGCFNELLTWQSNQSRILSLHGIIPTYPAFASPSRPNYSVNSPNQSCGLVSHQGYKSTKQ